MKTALIPAVTVAAVLAFSSVAFAEDAAPAAKPGTHVSFCGPVEAGPEHGCLSVKAMMPTPTPGLYDITKARPRPHAGMMIMGHGVVSGLVSICQRGTPLTRIAWHRVAVCPLAKGEDKH